MVSSVQKGDALEDAFYNYLINQQELGTLLDGLYKPSLCNVYKKKKYYCAARQSDIEFDVVIEVRREGDTDPAHVIVYECKDHKKRISHSIISEHCSKLNSVFPNNSKAVFVVTSQLQSGAMSLAQTNKVGVIRYDGSGFETILPRSSNGVIGAELGGASMFSSVSGNKCAKFSGYYDGMYFSSISMMNGCMLGFVPEAVKVVDPVVVPYMSYDQIDRAAKSLLGQLRYDDGAVDLVKAYDEVSVKLTYSIGNERQASKGILGEANFQNNQVTIYPHSNPDRERFTLAHELGHFYLDHGAYLRSETVVEADLFEGLSDEQDGFYKRMEYQANNFASCLLLPSDQLLKEVFFILEELGVKKFTHGFIYVDDQPCNYVLYGHIIQYLSSKFGVSKQALEIRLQRLNDVLGFKLFTDNRSKKIKFSLVI